MDLFNQDGAVFSDDRKYRYLLWRVWDETKPKMMFIGLNPSTANEITDDPTIRRVKSLASSMGFGGVYMVNLFAFVTPYPAVLKKCADPLGENDKWLKETADKSKLILFAWGTFPEAQDRASEIIRMFPDSFCLIKNADGSPRHPLYVRSDTKPIPFS